MTAWWQQWVVVVVTGVVPSSVLSPEVRGYKMRQTTRIRPETSLERPLENQN